MASNNENTAMRLSDIKPNPGNPRVIKDEEFKKLCKSIATFPKMMRVRGIAIDGDFVTAGGNMRLRALQEIKRLGKPWVIDQLKTVEKNPDIADVFDELFENGVVPDVWVQDISDFDEEEKQEFIIKDNVGFGEWDWDILRDEWDAGELEDWGIDIPEQVTELEPKKAEDDAYSMPSTVNTDIVLGDVIDIGPHRIVCGDCREQDVMDKLMQGKVADLLMTDPPYNVDYQGGTKDKLKIENDNMGAADFLRFLTDALTMGYAHMRPGAAAYVWHADSEGLNFRQAFSESGLSLKQCLIWVKNSLVLGRQDYQWRHEPCLYGWKPGAAHYFVDARTNSTVIDDKLDIKKMSKTEMQAMLTDIFSEKVKNTVLYHDKPSRSDEHPTMKPVPLIGDLIANSSETEQIVLDLFGGGGSTMVAGHQLARVVRSVEIVPAFVQVHVNRMRLLSPGIRVLRNGTEYTT